ncbi:response regulator transcription factor [soil metagenome]
MGAHRILLVDDHPMMRLGVGQLLSAQPDLEVAGEAGSAAEAFGLVQGDAGRFDLAIIDLTLPDRSGIELVKDLVAFAPRLRLLVMSMHDESLYAERVLKAGAHGYIMKEEAAAKLVRAVRQVIDGGIFVSDRMSTKMVAAMTGHGGGGGESAISRLTDRELEVFQLTGSGKGSREIAAILSVSVRTIDAHRAHLKQKLDLPDGPSLVREAVRWVESQNPR